MDRTPEPELMEEADQARAYAEADFAEPHENFVSLFQGSLPHAEPHRILDLGCGPGDVSRRFARRFEQSRVVGIDASEAMLEEGRRLAADDPVSERVQLLQMALPAQNIPADLGPFDTIISNSILHHLADPAILWWTVRAWASPGSVTFHMDLVRPASVGEVDSMVERYAADEPKVLQRDFRASLHAAYTTDEVRDQLAAAGLSHLAVDQVTDRHMIVWGPIEMGFEDYD